MNAVIEFNDPHFTQRVNSALKEGYKLVFKARGGGSGSNVCYWVRLVDGEYQFADNRNRFMYGTDIKVLFEKWMDTVCRQSIDFSKDVVPPANWIETERYGTVALFRVPLSDIDLTKKGLPHYYVEVEPTELNSVTVPRKLFQQMVDALGSGNDRKCVGVWLDAIDAFPEFKTE